MAPRDMNPDPRPEAYRRLAGGGPEAIEALAEGLRRQASARLAGRLPAAMRSRPVEFCWQRQPRRIRSLWENPVCQMAASGLAGMMLVLAGLGH